MNILTVQETAKILGVTESRIKQLIQEEKIKAQKLGRKQWLINSKSVTNYIVLKTKEN